MRIAVIMTCHNRKQKTLACLDSLYKIMPSVETFLTDDGSTDGTSDTVKSRYEKVHIIKGSGNLFWSRGMYAAWKEAIKGDYDFYLWLNDDVELYSYVMDELFECNRIGGKHCVVVGLIKDINSGKILYGGTNSKGQLIQESDTPHPICNMNGNVVLIPKSVVKEIGIIDPVYWHDIGDVDYGFMARNAGIPVLSTRKAVANGYSNPKFCRVRKWGTDVKTRFKKLYSPLGSNPNITFHFMKKHKGIIAAIGYYVFIHILNIMPDSCVKAIWNEKFSE